MFIALRLYFFPEEAVWQYHLSTMPNQTYHIPVIPSDLRQEETIKQICDSLEYLEKVADDIFKR